MRYLKRLALNIFNITNYVFVMLISIMITLLLICKHIGIFPDISYEALVNAVSISVIITIISIIYKSIFINNRS